eukprot:TRINITY_DN21051_c0_g1_i1.p1 TRINITY_DN21051_c0_g1~~TRINITY_DN21051_c0_g1_i1.p1  ORF type:complete len:131 (-),score=51.14 TRINITY_DN21051_c0_g1_i1:108-443(-)
MCIRDREWSEAKEEIKETINQSDNTAVVTSRVVVDKVIRNSSTAEAVLAMKKIDPDFDIIDMEEEVTHIFEKVHNAYLSNDTETLSKLCSSDALGFHKALLRVRIEKVDKL